MRSSTVARSASKSLFICESCRLLLNGGGRSSRRSFTLFKGASKDTGKNKTAEDGPLKIRYYDQVVRNDDKPSPIEPSKDERDTKALKARIDRLEGELQQMRKEGVLAIPSVITRYLKEEATETGDAASGSKSIDPSMAKDLNLLERLSKSLLTGKNYASDGSQNIARSTVQIATRREQRTYLNRLNGYLKQFEVLGFDLATSRQLWRWYVRCKQNIPGFCGSVSVDTWKILWESQSSRPWSDSDRAAHLRVLAQDLLASGQELSAPQKLEHIEALFANGERSKAISEWHAAEETLKEREDLAERFFSLGVKMFALEGDAEKAHRTAFSLLNDEKTNDARILLPVITAWTREGGHIALRRAWAAYLRLREMLESKMTMKDYDLVCKSFLDARRADLALGVFKDMMLSGDRSSGYDSSTLFQKALGRIREIRSLAYDAPELNKVSLEAMTALPKRFQNKYFYGSWIKKLLGAGDADSAALVADLMGLRGQQPDAKYLNGIVGAWMRRDDAESLEKAEAMAWKMIENRKMFAQKRRAAARGMDLESAPGPAPAHRVGGWTTSATLETFNIMVDYYLGRQKHDQIRWVYRSLKLAEYDPDALFMTRLLQSQLASEGMRRVWQTYQVWVEKGNNRARQDFELFDFLWECALMRAKRTSSLRQDQALEMGPGEDGAMTASTTNLAETTEGSFRNKDVLAAQHQWTFPSPRVLFHDMISWYARLSEKQRAANREEFSKAMYDKMVRCLLQNGSGDLAGVVVAMHALKEHLGMYPTQDTADDIVSHIARAETDRLRREQGSAVLSSHESTVLVLQRLQEISRGRVKLMEKRGVPFDDKADDRFKDEENLYLVSALLRQVLVKNRDVGDLDHTLQRAAWDMGVGGIEMGDHLRLV